MNFDWTDLAFASKKPLNDLKATFIAAPRELSMARFTQLVKTYLPKGNIVLGLAKEPYVLGFEEQPQFRTLQVKVVQPVIDKVHTSSSKHKIYTLNYFQREAPFIFERLRFASVLLVNGSWQYSFHMTPSYYALVSKGTPYELISPFVDEVEAQTYDAQTARHEQNPSKTGVYSETEMLALAAEVARQSFDHTYQTGVTLGKPSGSGYKLLATACNQVVPYRTYAMHFGALREKHFSPANDLNYYDTNHAEVAAIVIAQQQKLDLRGTTLFINLLPCPTCARMLAATDIDEFVYSVDHSEGYALKLLAAAGKKVRRVVL